MPFLWLAVRFLPWILGAVGVVVAYFWLQNHFTAPLKAENAQLRQDAADSQATLEAINAARERESAIIAELGERERDRGERIRVITRTITEHSADKDCPVSPAVDAAIDGAIE